MKHWIEKIFGKDYVVEFFNCLDYMEEWSFDRHTFLVWEHGYLMELSHFDQSVTIRIRPRAHSFWDKIQTYWDSIYEGLHKDYIDVLYSYGKFTGQEFPETPLSVSLFSSKYNFFYSSLFFRWNIKCLEIEKKTSSNYDDFFLPDSFYQKPRE